MATIAERTSYTGTPTTTKQVIPSIGELSAAGLKPTSHDGIYTGTSRGGLGFNLVFKPDYSSFIVEMLTQGTPCYQPNDLPEVMLLLDELDSPQQ